MRYMLILMLYCSQVFCEEFKEFSWLKEAQTNVDKEAVEWLKEQIRIDTDKNDETLQTKSVEKGKCKSCFTSNPELDHTDFPLTIFVSFSMGENRLLSLSKELEKVKGALVLCGLPNNSFKELSKRMLELKQKGLNATIQIDPLSFRKYDVKAVPTFVVNDSAEQFDKVSGNVSLLFALEKMANDGITSNSKKLFEQLKS